MHIEKKDFIKILDFLNLNGLNIDQNFLPKPIGRGQSNPTFVIQDNNSNLKVLRMQPPGELVRGAHRVDREFLVLKALKEKNFIVPEPIFLCTEKSILGRDFYLMEFVEGSIYEDPFLNGVEKESKSAIYKSLAKSLGCLHSFNIEELGIPFKKNPGFMKRNLGVWYNQIFSEEKEKDIEIEKIYNFVVKNLPDDSKISLLHGDYKLDNIVVGNDMECKAILDWELSSFGEREADLSFQMINWLIPKDTLYGLGGEWHQSNLPSAQKFLTWYEEALGESVNVELLNLSCLYSLTKLFCILKGIENRIKGGNAASEDAMTKAQAAEGVKTVLLEAFGNYPNKLIVE